MCHELPNYMGVPRFQLYSFMCGNMTMFDQLTLTCTYPDDAVPCSNAPDFYTVNDNIGQKDALFLTEDDMGRAEQYYEEDPGTEVQQRLARPTPKTAPSRDSKVANNVRFQQQQPQVMTAAPTSTTTTTTTTTTEAPSYKYTTRNYRVVKLTKKEFKKFEVAADGNHEPTTTSVEKQEQKVKTRKGFRGSRRKGAKGNPRTEDVSPGESKLGFQDESAQYRKKETNLKTLKKAVVKYPSVSGESEFLKGIKPNEHKETPREVSGQRKKSARTFKEETPESLLKHLESAFAQDYSDEQEENYRRIPKHHKKVVIVPKKKKHPSQNPTRSPDILGDSPANPQTSKETHKDENFGVVVLTKDFINVPTKSGGDQSSIRVFPAVQVPAVPTKITSSEGIDKEVPEELMKEIEKALTKQLEGALNGGERQATFSKDQLMREIEDSLKKEIDAGNLKKDQEDVPPTPRISVRKEISVSVKGGANADTKSKTP